MTIITMISKLNLKKTGIISIILIFFSVLFGFILVPKMIRSQLKNVSGDKKNAFWLCCENNKKVSGFNFGLV